MINMCRKFFAFLMLLMLTLPGISQTCYDCGDGSSGSFIATKDTVLPGGDYNFTDFYLAAGASLRFTGNASVNIRCKGSVVIDGKIDISGEDGGTATDNLTQAFGGRGWCGGFNGGNGVPGNAVNSNGTNGSGPGFGAGGISTGGFGAGFGSAGYNCNGLLNNLYGDSLLNGIRGGSGGGSGAVQNSNSSGAGGGGGGQLSIYACYPIIVGLSGEILLEGGNGGDGYEYGTGGGGGSGGSLLLTAKMVDIKGRISVRGGTGGRSPLDNTQCAQGGKGGDGRIRIDCSDITKEGTAEPGFYQKALFDAGIRRVVDAKCHGSSSGFIRARANGGERPYTFEWSNGSHAHELTDIPAGTYTITITDASGCSTTEQAVVAEPEAINVSVETYPPTCDNANNSIVLFSATGGTTFPYENALATTQWSNASGNGLLFSFGLTNRTNLKKIALQLKQTGNQHLVIYYRQGMGANVAFDSSQWQKVTELQFTNQSTEDLIPIDISMLSNLAAGNHSLYLYSYNSSISGVSSQALGSTFNFDHQITLYGGMARGSSTDPFNAPSTGIMNLAGRITYTIDAPNGENYIFGSSPAGGSVQTGIPAGQYQTIVSDVMGCTAQVAYRINPSNAIEIQTLQIKSPRCSDSEDGAIEVAVNANDIRGFAATPPASSHPQSGVFLQAYTGETIQLEGIELYAASAVIAELYIKRGVYSGFENDIASWTSLGSLQSSMPDGIGKVQFNLSTPVQLDPDQWSLCIRSTGAPIFLQPARLNFINSGILHMNSTGFQSLSPFNQVTTIPGEYFAGTLRYSIATGQLNSYWSNNTTGTSLTGLAAGTYSYTVDYNNQCSTSKSFTLTSPTPISLQASIHTETDHEEDGSILIHPEGGTPPYYIQWPQNSSTGASIHQLSSGDYPVFLADANGCIFRDTIHLARFDTPIKPEGWLTILPNPGHGYIKVGEEVKGMENCTLRVFDVLGRLAYQENTSISKLMSEGLDIHHFIDANYILQVSDDDQIFQARAIIIH